MQDVEKGVVQASQGIIRDAIVSVRGDLQFLVAHLVFTSHVSDSEKERFFGSLTAKLSFPQYTVPVMGIPLQQIPLESVSSLST